MAAGGGAALAASVLGATARPPLLLPPPQKKEGGKGVKKGFLTATVVAAPGAPRFHAASPATVLGDTSSRPGGCLRLPPALCHVNCLRESSLELSQPWEEALEPTRCPPGKRLSSKPTGRREPANKAGPEAGPGGAF